MRFRVINQGAHKKKGDKSDEKETQTRNNSNGKNPKRFSFLEMVRNSYQFYQSLGKDYLIEAQRRVQEEKLAMMKKNEKKLKQQRKRRQIKQQKDKYQQAEMMRLNRRLKRKKYELKREQKLQNPIIRRSSRNKKCINYSIIESQQQQDKNIFNVLDLNESQSSIKDVNYQGQQNIKNKKMSQIKIQTFDQELIFQEQGTYQIGMAHEAILRVQQTIDEFLNFKHQIRQAFSIDLRQLFRYLRTQGFATFSQDKFDLLVKLNPYLYVNRQSSDPEQRIIATFKLNSIEINSRLESTRRRMTQVSLPQLFT